MNQFLNNTNLIHVYTPLNLSPKNLYKIVKLWKFYGFIQSNHCIKAVFYKFNLDFFVILE